MFAERETNLILRGFAQETDLRPVVTEDKKNFKFEYRKNMINVIYAALLRKLESRGMSACIEVFLRSRVLIEGPKIFRPAADNLEALENMKINIPITEYVQPFPTLIIEFPDKYTKNKIVKNPTPGPRDWGIIAGEEHSLTMGMVHHAKEIGMIFLGIVFSSGDIYTTGIWEYIPNASIEETLELLMTRAAYDKSVQTTDEERDMVWDAYRAVLNCCLMMEDLGIKDEGWQRPIQHKKIINQLRTEKRPAAIRNLKADLAEIPRIYSFDQNIKLYRTETPMHHSHGQETGRHVKPHWRRGHWKMQPHGPNNTLRKRIRIDSVLVNKEYFGGDLQDTTVTYRG